VVDIHVSVVAHSRRIAGEDGPSDIHFVPRENRRIEKVGGRLVAELGETVKETRWCCELRVREVDVRLRGHQPYGKTQGITESAVGIGKSEKQLWVQVRGAGDNVAMPCQDLHGFNGLVHQTIFERR